MMGLVRGRMIEMSDVVEVGVFDGLSDGDAASGGLIARRMV